VAIQSPTSIQLTFRLSGTIEATELIQDPESNDLLLTIRPAARATQADLEQRRKRWKLDVIVLDAGHGGHDPGTIGASGTREKDITLAITLKLGKLLEKNLKEVRVAYTRKDDRFIELYRRGQIANEADGKLFISIHCNSMHRKPHPMRGFEVYLLRPGRTEDAVAIAERENAVIELEEGTKARYQELTEENFILVAMAQSAYVRSSETFADMTQQELERKTDLPNRGVKQAGFYVLVGAAMPNVLIETGYLSNRTDERFLRSQAGQHQIAESIFAAIKRYKQEYERLLMEGKDIGGM
jgi:N-acetylmuramoyl-L-alanine amidase